MLPEPGHVPAHALVVGKFYPPHAGHHLLIRTAARTSRRVTVVVAAASVESIPLANRLGWLREVHAAEGNVTFVGTVDDHPVDLADEAIWNAHVGVFRRAVASTGAGAPDAVYTSEGYGEELARRLGARHVSVDPDRRLAPVSGTEVRADPRACWEFLSAPVRGWFAKRVVLVGAESTGKSTLAAELAAALCARGGVLATTRLVPEYGREFAVAKLAEARARACWAGAAHPSMEDVVWSEEDFVGIAAEQRRREDVDARLGGPVLVCDTDAFATSLWHERYRQVRSPAVERLSASDGAGAGAGGGGRLYLLTHDEDVPFVQDGTRDGERVRRWMTDTFAERLAATGRRTVVLRGTRDARLRAAVAAADAFLGEGWSLAAPLG